MALAATAVWEVRTTGNDTNGGGFNSAGAGTDFSQQNAKNTVGNNISTTDAVAVGTTTLTSATAAFTSAIVGNIIYLQGGTGSLVNGWYQVNTFTNGTTIILDRVVASGTGITMNIGGALASLGMVGFNAINGHSVYIQAGNYSITSNTANISGGKFGSGTILVYIKGYGTVRSDYAATPVFTYTVTGATRGITIGGGWIANITLDGGSQATSTGFSISNNSSAVGFRLTAQNMAGSGFTSGSNGGYYLQCYANVCATGFSLSGNAYGCISTVSGIGFSVSTGVYATRCIAIGGTTAFDLNSGSNISGCLAIGSTLGYNLASASRAVANSCIAATCTTGYALSTGAGILMFNCAYYNCATPVSGGTGLFTFQVGNISITNDPFTNSAGGDYSLNNVAGGGALLRATGYPGIFPNATTTGYLDVGPVQHQDSGGGSGGEVSSTYFG